MRSANLNQIKMIVIVIVIIALLLGFSSHIRYFISNGSDTVLACPHAFAFGLATENIHEYLYYTSEEKYDEEYDEDGYDIDTNTYHIYVDGSYLNNNDAYIYISGDYWNCPSTPTIKVDGKIIDEVSTSNTGYADGTFSDTYFSKMYHFYFEDKVLPDHRYEIYVRCGQRSDSVFVVFHQKGTC